MKLLFVFHRKTYIVESFHKLWKFCILRRSDKPIARYKLIEAELRTPSDWPLTSSNNFSAEDLLKMEAAAIEETADTHEDDSASVVGSDHVASTDRDNDPAAATRRGRPVTFSAYDENVRLLAEEVKI
jgi:hypothetical protein